MSDDDRARSVVIEHLMCNLELPLELTVAETRHGLDELIGGDMERLSPWVEEDFLHLEGRRYQATPLGRHFIRNIAMVLDPYLQTQRDSTPRFSTTV